jgi:hypothetical protein
LIYSVFELRVPRPDIFSKGNRLPDNAPEYRTALLGIFEKKAGFLFPYRKITLVKRAVVDARGSEDNAGLLTDRPNRIRCCVPRD